MLLAQLPDYLGPMPLTTEVLDAVEEYGLDGHGVYILGPILNGTFVPHRVGRSDDCADGVLGRVRQYVNNHGYRCCTHMGLKYVLTSVADRYHEECRVFHNLGGANSLKHNTNHPDRPDGQTSLKCKYCKHFG